MQGLTKGWLAGATHLRVGQGMLLEVWADQGTPDSSSHLFLFLNYTPSAPDWQGGDERSHALPRPLRSRLPQLRHLREALTPAARSAESALHPVDGELVEFRRIEEV